MFSQTLWAHTGQRMPYISTKSLDMWASLRPVVTLGASRHFLAWVGSVVCALYCEIWTLRRYLLIYFINGTFMWGSSHFHRTIFNRVWLRCYAGDWYTAKRVCCVVVRAVTYLMTTMTLGTVSVCMTVLVLNVHHRGADSRVPPLLRRVLLVHLARVVGVRTSALDAARGRQPSFTATGRDHGSSPPSGPPPMTTIPGVVLRRRLSLQRQRGRSGSTRRHPTDSDNARTLSCHYVPLDGVANDVSAADHVITSNADGAPPPPLVPAGGNETLRNGPSSLGLRVSCLAMSYGRRWRHQHQQLQHQRRLLFDTTGSVVGGRLSRSGGGIGISHSPPASPSRPPLTVNDLDVDCHPAEDRGLHELSTADDSDVAVINEWTELARVLDRTFFWLLFALMTMSAIVILLYPKYTGNEDDWTPND